MRKLQVAIDGPAGAGKSTVARIVADRLGYTYIDSGAMYRAVALAVLERGLDPAAEAQIAELAEALDIRLDRGQAGARGPVFMDGKDVTDALRTPEVSELVPAIAQHQALRRVLVAQQKRIAADGGVVMDGRDIGTVVLPEAEVKVFLTASIAERTRRRIAEMEARGVRVDPVRIRTAIVERDQLDRARAASPLRQASDARLIDTSDVSIEEAVDAVLGLCRQVATR